MRKLATIIIVFLSIFSFTSLFAQSDTYVNGYYKKNGTYVQPHFKTAPNNSMFDNYSTKGNYNPYTGKPGWIDPYSKVSSSYYSAIPYSYRPSYEKLFLYLNKKDSHNYFKIVDAFDYQYKLFFTGIFKLNNNDTKEANQIFDILRKNKGSSSFIFEESTYWFNITSTYLDADEEFNKLYASSAKYDRDGNYPALENQLNSVRNPLNFYHKYLIKFNADWQRHKYYEAKNSLDSLIAYSSGDELQDSLIAAYDDIVANMNNMQNTLDTRLNGTYYYDIENMINNLKFFLVNGKMPISELKRACFKLFKEGNTVEDTVFRRTLNDTSNYNIANSKDDFLKFHIHVSKKHRDTTRIISLQFFDDSSFLFYKKICHYTQNFTVQKIQLHTILVNLTKKKKE
ncbi:MAG: hypothetical protein IPL84_18525 [Chitinophagaceae bacterium]|nr:hypothetical protein [Chitinophagaceae bacterium]